MMALRNLFLFVEFAAILYTWWAVELTWKGRVIKRSYRFLP